MNFILKEKRRVEKERDRGKQERKINAPPPRNGSIKKKDPKT